MTDADERDPIYDSDRNGGVTPPESDEQGSNIVGRPGGERAAGFHEHAESAELEREPFSAEQALSDGGSFDGLGPPVAGDAGREPGASPE